MKKICLFLMAFMLAPMNVQAEKALDQASSFQIARAFKLGRDVSTTSSKQNSRVVKTSRTACASSQYVKDGECTGCPSNATCNGHTFKCKSGYIKSGSTCVADCSKITIANGTCTACSSPSTCTSVSCSSGYKASGAACVLDCSKITVANGTCTACSSPSTCTGVSCSSGYEADGVSCVASNDTSDWWFINTDGAITVPDSDQYKRIQMYGHYADITVPVSRTYNTFHVQMWGYANVSGSFKTGILQTSYLTHPDETPTITFNDAVTVTGTVYLHEAKSSTAGNRKGAKLIFKKGLKGSPTCTTISADNDSQKTYPGGTCTCTTSECTIDE
ncbi:MAG: hypothetical protein IJ752_07605 [Alphaproteobacteria bacterium]|nr:hypothetical protein [Alphaproteobacteria bacterium]